MRKAIPILICFFLLFTFSGCQLLSEPMTTDTESEELIASEVAFDLSDFEGSYQDSFSQRAGAEVFCSDKGLDIIIHWANSAFSYCEWNMRCIFVDGKLVYDNCSERLISFDENEKETYEIMDFPSKGYFEIMEGNLCWTGAGDDYCAQCIFEKIS